MMRVAPSLGALALVLVASTAASQDAAKPDSARLHSRLFVKRDLVVLGAFTAATFAMFPLDRQLATTIRDSSLINNPDVERAAKTFGFLGSPGPFIIGSAMYVIGRYGDKPRMAHLAVHGTEAIFVGAGMVFVLKTVLGRTRPWASPDTNPGDFQLGRGFRADKYQAFPSGHATVAFSVAAAVTAETSEWWPRSTWIIGPVLYGGATLVGLSRMYEDKHWASDVVMGAAVGVFAGLKTVRFNHTRAGNRVDRWLLGDSAPRLRLGATPEGVMTGFSWRW
jgi:membrane-associated phospholipid phosphatase